MPTAVVTRVVRARVWVDYLGEAVPCRGCGAKLLPGDVVKIKRLADTTYAVTGLGPRKGEIVRLPVGRRGRVAMVNVDQVIVVTEISPARDDGLGGEDGLGRLLGPVHSDLVGTCRRTSVVVVASKCDLRDASWLGSRVADWVERGIEVLLASVASGQGLGELRSRLQGRTSALVGAPGAGKTSLIEALFPGYELREGAAELHPVPGGGYVVV